MSDSNPKEKAAGEENVPFEQSLRELEELVERLEQGDISLEDSMKDFERGMALAKALSKRLETAQLQVEKVLEKANGEIAAEPLDLEEDDDV